MFDVIINLCLMIILLCIYRIAGKFRGSAHGPVRESFLREHRMRAQPIFVLYIV